MHRSLIMAPTSIGDAVDSQPLVAALARRGAVVTVAAHPSVAPVYRAMGPAVAAVIELSFTDARLQLSSRWAVGRSWQRRYDVAYVLPHAWQAALLPWLAQVGRRVGYPGRWRSLLINDGPALPAQPGPRSAHYLHLAGAASAEPGGPAPALQVAPERVEAALGRFELQAGGYWVLVPGARGGVARAWPAAHYAALARQLHQQTAQPVVLLGDGAELALAEHIAAQLEGVDVRVLAGRTRLDDAMALLAAARGMVGNDAGLSAVAAALGRPQVVLFGPSRPPSPAAHALRTRQLFLAGEQAPECAPCAQRTCAQGHLRCLQELAPARVLDALFDAAGLQPPSAAVTPRRVAGGR